MPTPTAPPLVQADDIVAYLGLVESNENLDRLAVIADFADTWLKAKTRPDWQQIARTELLQGNGTKFLVLKHYPVASLTSISVQDGTLTTDLDVTDNLQVDLSNADQGIVTRTNGDVWPKQPYRNINVAYIGGPDGIPGYLTGAALELAAFIYQTTGGRISVSTPDASVTFQNLMDKGYQSLPGVMEAIRLSQDIVYGSDGGS